MEFLEADHPEWQEMWEHLALHPLNNGDPICRSHNTAWEYMGSTQDHHHLRHAIHPATGKIEYVYIERRRAGVAWAQSA
ncbi:4-diphosphocytidyl-2C-methyl-D-erythritol kinase [Saccharophagus degradans]|uniref:4-diphosphocytidyl-2C-methyl-D-erythritol kinase n=1 Tax=Saccharophagus degradans TaxID=86304 RepID=A0AAW7X5V6_9GAMM|nr:4-diphosphocytidyl-2C-methyl-D-erythritol kinase [Saccharophagus degradans]MBU2984314.1 4-diphosphocytidyl-2C-methyl-D-erythritol kinase [Saccharophagus degradans]MDO6422924.1 4-diphosphocytidyl-2C-methyl-D-erythritol kinase [Saccharophagus degradans]MDO6607069.1 4-diphosphocytidyl-2C-methyl-D-erythritol kinase [Saccharophagus degradans]WGO97330.1 4-diphosphocytidyl-2C-methyl-D-erythritol kinase [Saccharophagus degradans]